MILSLFKLLLTPNGGRVEERFLTPFHHVRKNLNKQQNRLRSLSLLGENKFNFLIQTRRKKKISDFDDVETGKLVDVKESDAGVAEEQRRVFTGN